jgi:hypothetical protein
MGQEHGTVESHIEAALENTADDTARFHLRQALQLRVAEEADEERISV